MEPTAGARSGLISPPFQLDAAQLAAVELRLAAGTTARDAQIFFRDGAGQLDEARSLRFSLQPGTEAHTYRLEIPEEVRRQGLITGIRLDPVGVGDGGSVRIETIRLVLIDG
ncbi:MAG: hypothetical protein HC822_03155 [Oscillochloris sp.]|nr:hypothetical protein [Oscillochloris sp.]